MQDDDEDINVHSHVYLRRSFRLTSRSRIRQRISGMGVPSARQESVNDEPARIECNGGLGRKSTIRGGTRIQTNAHHHCVFLSLSLSTLNSEKDSFCLSWFCINLTLIFSLIIFINTIND